MISNLLDKTKSWGVVEFNVLGDTYAALRAGVQLALTEHKSFTHFRVVINKNVEGQHKSLGNELHLCWSSSSKVTELPFPLKDIDAICMFISSWITEKGVYNQDTYVGGDGSDNEGVRLTNDYPENCENRTDYLALRVIPEYVYYGK